MGRSFLLVVTFIVLAIGCSSKNKCTDKGFTECKQRCDDSDMQACYETGDYLFMGTSGDNAGTPVAKDERRALTYFEKACKASVDDACISLAYAYVTGTGTRVDINRAVEAADPVCAKGVGKACGLLVRAATTAGMDPSAARTRAIDAYKKECDADRGGAAGRGPCWDLATEGWLPLDEAMKYAQITCDRGEHNYLCKDNAKMKEFLTRTLQH